MTDLFLAVSDNMKLRVSSYLAEEECTFGYIRIASLSSLKTIVSKGCVSVLCVLVLFLGIVLVSSGCTNSAKESTKEDDMVEIVITQDDQGKSFAVQQGNIILIRLAENPTTGYQWEGDAVDEQIIMLQGSDFSMGSETGIGGGGTKTFSFKALSPGLAQVQLKLRREWEPEDAAIDRFEVTIRVQ